MLPAYKDELLSGLDAASQATRGGDLCGAIAILNTLRLRTDGYSAVPDWVQDLAIRQSMYTRISALVQEDIVQAAGAYTVIWDGRQDRGGLAKTWGAEIWRQRRLRSSASP